jgi:hypothetical protein
MRWSCESEVQLKKSDEVIKTINYDKEMSTNDEKIPNRFQHITYSHEHLLNEYE